MRESERLARRYFALFRRGETDRLLEFLHPEVEISLKTTGDVLRGRDEVAAFIEDVSGRFYETQADVFRPLDDERIVVEGRMRWMNEDRILRDDPMIWALEFDEGQLRRSLPAQSFLEAQALLAAPRRSGT